MKWLMVFFTSSVLFSGCSRLSLDFKTNDNGRYQIISHENMPTVLLDTATGATWRNVKCGEKDNEVENCWQSMTDTGMIKTLFPMKDEEFNKQINESIDQYATTQHTSGGYRSQAGKAAAKALGL